MSFVWASALKDLRRRARDPVALLLWAGMPFVVGVILTLAFGRAGVKPQAHLLVADQDESMLSGLLVGVLGQGQLAEILRVEPVEIERGRELIGRGSASALLVIPEGFGSDVLGRTETDLELVTNPAQTILPRIAEEILSLLVDAVFYLQLILGDDIQEFVQGPPGGAASFPDDAVVGLSVRINQLVERVSEYLFPPVMGLATAVDDDEPEDLNLGALFFQSMFFMAIVFLSQALADDIWTEKEGGTLRRILTAPRDLGSALAGKLLAGGLLIAAVSGMALTAAGWVYGISASRILLAVLWSTASGVAFLSLFTLLQLFASSRRTAGLLASFVVFPMLMLGGSFFPFELMPDWLVRIGRWTPNGWAITQLKAILDGSADLSSVLPAAAGLVLVTALSFVVSTRRVRWEFALS